MLRRGLLVGAGALLAAPRRLLAQSRASRLELLNGFPAPLLDFDFANGVYRQDAAGYSTTAADFITTSRASTGYADNRAGIWSSFGNNVPRITNKGLLVEEARTNSLRNNSMQGAVAGSPGTIPTFWATSTIGLTRTVVGVGTANGVDYIDIRVNGTTSSQFGVIQFETNTAITASNGQTWAESVFVAISGGSAANLSDIGLTIRFNDSGGTQLTQINSSILSSLGSTLTRFSQVGTATNASTARVTGYVYFNGANASGDAVDITLRIGWPQLELGAFATSPIRTTAGAVTRAADVVTVTTSPVFGLAYTLFASGVPNAPEVYATNQVALGVNNGTANERSRLRRVASTGVAQGVVTTGGVDTVLAGTTWAASTSNRVALGIAANNQAFAQNGPGSVAGAASAMPTTPTIVTVGTDQSTTLSFNGFLARVAIWPTTRLSNAALQRIVQ